MVNESAACGRITPSLCLIVGVHASACLRVTMSAWLTRVHSRRFEMLLYNSPETSAAQHCGGNDNGACGDEAQREMMASKCNLWLCGKRLLVLRPDTTPCGEVSEGRCSPWHEWVSVAAWYAIGRRAQVIVQLNTQSARWICRYVWLLEMCVLFAAGAAWVVVMIIVILTQDIPARFSTRVHLSQASELFIRVAAVHISAQILVIVY